MTLLFAGLALVIGLGIGLVSGHKLLLVIAAFLNRISGYLEKSAKALKEK